jgi:hypothetical protein
MSNSNSQLNEIRPCFWDPPWVRVSKAREGDKQRLTAESSKPPSSLHGLGPKVSKCDSHESHRQKKNNNHNEHRLGLRDVIGQQGKHAANPVVNVQPTRHRPLQLCRHDIQYVGTAVGNSIQLKLPSRSRVRTWNGRQSKR